MAMCSLTISLAELIARRQHKHKAMSVSHAKSADLMQEDVESIKVLSLTNIVDEPCDISKKKAKVLENLPPIKTISIKIQLILQLLL